MKMTAGILNQLAQLKEKENASIELKSFDKITNLDDKNRKDIACEMVAFANRNGGKIIFGMKDDGSFETGININVDELKGKIHSICFDNISPVIEAPTEFIEENDNKTLIVHVPKRKSIPHAFIENRSNHEIDKRIYYIRTSHGKRLVTDGQLQWLFQNTGEPNYTFSFRIGFEFNKQMEMVGDIVPWGNYEFTYFKSLLNEQDLNMILKESKNFTRFVNGLLPYMILKSLNGYFKDSWHIGIAKGFDRLSSGPMITDIPAESISIFIHEVPVVGESFVHKLSWNFNQLIKELLPQKFHLSPDTSIEIIYPETNESSSIVFKNPSFKIELLTGMLSGGAGLHQKGVLHDLLFQRYAAEEQQNSLFHFLHYDAACYLNADFNYPEYDMDEFDMYLGYYNSLKELLIYNWDFDIKRKEYAPKEILVIDDKLNEVLEILKSHTNHPNK
jgi:hypothetical protein